MTTLKLTRHGEMRMQQRGMSRRDVELVYACGTQTEPGSWLMLRRDVKREIEARRREIQTLERIEGRKVVVIDGVLISTYVSGSLDQKRTLRRGRAKAIVRSTGTRRRGLQGKRPGGERNRR